MNEIERVDLLGEAHHPVSLGWHPFAIFEYPGGWSPATLACVALALAASVMFLVIAIRDRKRFATFFSLPLVLALTPLLIFSVIMFLQVYRLMPVLRHLDMGDVAVGLYGAAHAFQFGLLLSGILVGLHGALYVGRRKTLGNT